MIGWCRPPSRRRSSSRILPRAVMDEAGPRGRGVGAGKGGRRRRRGGGRRRRRPTRYCLSCLTRGPRGRDEVLLCVEVWVCSPLCPQRRDLSRDQTPATRVPHRTSGGRGLGGSNTSAVRGPERSIVVSRTCTEFITGGRVLTTSLSFTYIRHRPPRTHGLGV